MGRLTEEERREAGGLLKAGSPMFRNCTGESVRLLAAQMEVFRFARGDKLLEQGVPSEYMYVMSSGEVQRYREESGMEHQVVDKAEGVVGSGVVEGGLRRKIMSGRAVAEMEKKEEEGGGIPSGKLENLSRSSFVSSSAAFGTVAQVDPNQHTSTINSMHSLRGDPPYATAVCISDVCKAFALSQQKFTEVLGARTTIATEIITSLQKEVRDQKRALRTPFLELKNRKDINVPAVAMAAAIESYYRSALNAMLNARLLGQKAALFPNMHIQVPARALYINGFKGMRAFFDRNVRPEEYQNPNMVRYAVAIGPGILMNPISSLLEASNAGHMNPEGMHVRWMRGFVPRAVREVIFGVGLNQLSDFCEERWMPYVPSKSLANAAGSLTAGVVAGYLSHVPHNLSAYKLMEPHRTYGEHFRRFVDSSVPEHLVPKGLPPSLRNLCRSTLAVLFPRGCVIRTTQIVGSFMILNGTIGYLARLDQERINRAFGESPAVPVVE